jgi:hypothetical protein
LQAIRLVGIALPGQDNWDDHLFSYVRLEDRIPKDQPLRAIRELVDPALRGEVFIFSQALRLLLTLRSGKCGEGGTMAARHDRTSSSARCEDLKHGERAKQPVICVHCLLLRNALQRLAFIS